MTPALSFAGFRVDFVLLFSRQVPAVLEAWSSRQRGFLLALFVPLAVVVIADWRLRRQR